MKDGIPEVGDWVICEGILFRVARRTKRSDDRGNFIGIMLWDGTEGFTYLAENCIPVGAELKALLATNGFMLACNGKVYDAVPHESEPGFVIQVGNKRFAILLPKPDSQASQASQVDTKAAAIALAEAFNGVVIDPEDDEGWGVSEVMERQKREAKENAA